MVSWFVNHEAFLFTIFSLGDTLKLDNILKVRIMKTISVKQAQQADLKTQKEVGIPGLVLMERAALKAADNLWHTNWNLNHVLVVAGSGNNGGDGLAVARLLAVKGVHVDILLLGNPKHYSDEHQTQLHTCKYYHVPVVDPKNVDWKKYTVIIDAIFGTGLSRPVAGNYVDFIKKINQAPARVQAIDIPSGLNGSTGKVMGVSVKADLTSTFAYAKNGMVKPEAKPYIGKLIVNDIGIYC